MTLLEINDMTLLEDFKIPYIFRQGKSPIPGEYRPWWRLVLILLMLSINGRGMKLSFKQLQILDWALRAEENYESLEQFFIRDTFPISSVVTIDPALNRAVNFGVGKKLLRLNVVSGGCRIELETSGAMLANKVRHDGEILSEEIALLLLIGKKLTGPVADRLLS